MSSVFQPPLHALSNGKLSLAILLSVFTELQTHLSTENLQSQPQWGSEYRTFENLTFLSSIQMVELSKTGHFRLDLKWLCSTIQNADHLKTTCFQPFEIRIRPDFGLSRIVHVIFLNDIPKGVCSSSVGITWSQPAKTFGTVIIYLPNYIPVHWGLEQRTFKCRMHLNNKHYFLITNGSVFGWSEVRDHIAMVLTIPKQNQYLS